MVSENEFLIHALLLGVYITFVYDWLRIFRRVMCHSSFFVFIEDMGFWAYCAQKVFLLMYHESDGTLRWFAVLGAFAGMFLYKKLISEFLVKYAALIIGKVLGFLWKLLVFFSKPFRFLGRKLTSPFKHLLGRGKRAVKFKLTALVKMFTMKKET